MVPIGNQFQLKVDSISTETLRVRLQHLQEQNEIIFQQRSSNLWAAHT